MYVCLLLYARNYSYSRGKDVHHNAQKSRKKANGERISYFRMRKKEMRFERSAVEVSIVFFPFLFTLLYDRAFIRIAKCIRC